MNAWKITGIVLIVVVLGLVAWDMVKDTKVGKIMDVDISKTSFNSIERYANEHNWTIFKVSVPEEGKEIEFRRLGK